MGSRVKSNYFKIIHTLSSVHPLSLLLRASNLSRSGFYKWRRLKAKRKSSHDGHLELLITEIHFQWPFYGYRRITSALRRTGISVNHKL
ncbi:IS3 family transposase [Halodesulfovibrio marinisediminis]|uniref:IS3 family transposase n=1 Tax=Halodesulfovibrio marinisediminis TaxID=458711 RepID=UPI00389939B7